MKSAARFQGRESGRLGCIMGSLGFQNSPFSKDSAEKAESRRIYVKRPDREVGEAWRKFWAEVEEEWSTAARDTRYGMAQTLRLLSDVATGPMEVDVHALSQIRERLAADGTANATKNRRLRELRALCNNLVRDGYIDVSPFAHWTRFRGRGRKRRLFFPDERGRQKSEWVPSAGDVQAILDQAGRDVDRTRDRDGYHESEPYARAVWRRALVNLLFHTGLRPGEALYLLTSEFDEATGEITLDIPAREEAFERHGIDREALKIETASGVVPFSIRWTQRIAWSAPGVAYQAFLDQYRWARGVDRDFVFCCFGSLVPPAPNGGTKNTRPVYQLRNLGERAGLCLNDAARNRNVRGLTLEMGRHIFSTYAKSKFGLTPPQVQAVLRHTTETMQRHYDSQAAQVRSI